MYRLNPLNRNVLITIDEVVAKAAIDPTADIRILQNSIEIAEERFIAPALGSLLYEDMLTQKNVLVTSGNQSTLLAQINASLPSGATHWTTDSLPIGALLNAIELVTNTAYTALWNRYLWRLTAEAVDMTATVPSWLRHTAQGQQMNNPNIIGGNGTGSASGAAKDIGYKMDRLLQDRINPLQDRMRAWLCQTRPNVPLYDFTNNCPTCSSSSSTTTDGINTQSKGGWVLGVYDGR
jgi:hypothetical protein